MNIKLDRVEDAIADIAAGRAVVVVDDEDRENAPRAQRATGAGEPARAGRTAEPMRSVA